jgi:hypothetical protein
MTMRLLRLLGVLSLVVLGTAGSAMAIVGGQADGSAHPYVGLVRDGHTICSGSLVSRTVFVTAAHCFAGSQSIFGTSADGHPIVQITFDPAGVTTDARLNLYGTAYNDPQFCGGCSGGLPGFASHDLAVVRMAAPVPSSVVPRLASLPRAGQSQGLKVHAPVDVVGFGVQMWSTGKGQPQIVAGGSRAWVGTELANAGSSIADKLLKLASTSSSGGFCLGDSGGPVLDGGTDTILGLNSFLPDSYCKGTTYAYRLDTPDALAFVGGFLR